MMDALAEALRLFNRNVPAPELKPVLRATVQRLNKEASQLDSMTICLPLESLQREQRHVLRHAVWLLRYLDSHLTDNDGEFFCSCMTWRWDVFMGSLTFLSHCMTERGTVAPACRLI